MYLRLHFVNSSSTVTKSLVLITITSNIPLFGLADDLQVVCARLQVHKILVLGFDINISYFRTSVFSDTRFADNSLPA